ncbi:hypothetical protein BH18PSE1_BH18PSE1_12910 [soil metagenome]
MRPDLIKALAVVLDLVEPAGGLEPEGDRQARLTVGAPAHRCIPIAAGEDAQGVRYSGELTSEDLAHLDQNPRRMRIGDVLHRRPVTKPFPAVARTAALKGANETEQRVIGPLEVFAHFGKKRLIERYDTTGIGELSSRRGGDQTEFGLLLGEHDHDLDPTGGQRGIVEERTQFGRAPRVSIDG